MKKNLTLVFPVSLLILASCNSGGGSGGGITAPNNAFTQYHAVNPQSTINYMGTGTVSSECISLINNANNILFGSSSMSYAYLTNNSSAQICDYNNANCLNVINNSNNPCVTGSQNISINSDGSNPIKTNVAWTKCSYNPANLLNKFTANLTIAQRSLTCTGIVQGS